MKKGQVMVEGCLMKFLAGSGNPEVDLVCRVKRKRDPGPLVLGCASAKRLLQSEEYTRYLHVNKRSSRNSLARSKRSCAHLASDQTRPKTPTGAIRV